MEITRKPNYSIEQMSDGTFLARFTVQIDGRDIISEFRSNNTGDAISGASTRLQKTVKNRYENLSENEINKALGSPERVEPSTTRHSDTTFMGPQQPLEERLPNTSPSIDSSSLRPGDMSGAKSDSRKPSQTEKDKKDFPMVKGIPKNHVDYMFSLDGKGVRLDGTGENILKEPIPKYFERPGDELYEGANNTAICLGRDIAPQNSQIFSKNISKRNYNSGFSSHMGAGAIDIVAGRMAPFPLENLGILKDIIVAPSFNTEFPAEIQDIDLTNGKHPGFVMDAARIYISQMTVVDESFKISQDLFSDTVRDADFAKNDSPEVVPTSAIMIKSDKIRLHARQDIKIVTGGPHEPYNSQGNSIKTFSGIHLMAQNGVDQNGQSLKQQPIPKGDNLINCLQDMLGLINDLSGAVDVIVESQRQFNAKVMNHFHAHAPGAVTVPDPIVQLSGVADQIDKVKSRFSQFFQDVNNFTHRTNYFSPICRTYINSRYNTTN
tara:strand:+ start:816 stop:2294 length:1479 start_codon:yes stop_codon:yes gene_type:complete